MEKFMNKDNSLEKELFEKIKKLIDDKRVAMDDFIKDKNTTHIDFVEHDINMLKKYIDGDIYLTENDTDNLLSNLIQYRISLSIPIKNIHFARARIIDDKKEYPIYDDVSLLSYMPLHLEKRAPLGRFNKKEQTMYYGTLFNTHDDLNVPFQEIDVKVDDYVNTLISYVIEEIKVIIIGLFSLVENKNTFIQLHPIFEKINNYYNETHSVQLLEAIKKVDHFFCYISKKEGNQRVHKVTSILGNIYMEGDLVDGILYESTKDKGNPNIVLKPSSIDKKLKHIDAKISLAKYDKNENEIVLMELIKGKVNNCKIEWEYK